MCAGRLGDGNAMVFCITLTPLWLCVYFLNLCVCVLVMSCRCMCGDACVCVCVRERKLNSTEGVCLLAGYHVNVLCFLSTWLCKTRQPLSGCQGCSVLMPGPAQCRRSTPVCPYRRRCWPHLDGAVPRRNLECLHNRRTDDFIHCKTLF